MDDPVHPSMGDLSRIPSVAPSGLSGVGDSSTKQTRKILNPFENFRRTAADKRTENLGERRLLIDIQLCMSAGLAIAIMMSENLVVWYAGSTLIEQGEMVLPANDYDTWVFYFVAGSRALTACLTVYSIIMIAQYYYLLLTFKRQEWGKDLLSGSVAAAPARRRAGSVAAKKYDQEKAAANTFRTTKHATGVKHEYSFIRSTLFWKFLIEVGVHLLFPYPFVSLTLYNFLQMSMFLRLYLVARLLHTNSAAFKKRNRIRSYHEDFRRMNWKIGFKLTMKILFYEHSIAMVLCCTVTTLVLGAFCMFILERNKFDGEDHLFAKYPNCLWFAFVTFTTIGYGDMYPRTASARAVTVVIGVIGQIILAVFGGVVTNKLAPSKQQQLIVSYLKQETGQEGYEHAAASLIQQVWLTHRRKKARLTGKKVDKLKKSHKKNVVYAAVKCFKSRRAKLVDAQLQASDRVVDHKLDELTTHVEELTMLVQQVLAMQGAAAMQFREVETARQAREAAAAKKAEKERQGSLGNASASTTAFPVPGDGSNPAFPGFPAMFPGMPPGANPWMGWPGMPGMPGMPGSGSAENGQLSPSSGGANAPGRMPFGQPSFGNTFGRRSFGGGPGKRGGGLGLRSEFSALTRRPFSSLKSDEDTLGHFERSAEFKGIGSQSIDSNEESESVSSSVLQQAEVVVSKPKAPLRSSMKAATRSEAAVDAAASASGLKKKRRPRPSFIVGSGANATIMKPGNLGMDDSVSTTIDVDVDVVDDDASGGSEDLALADPAVPLEGGAEAEETNPLLPVVPTLSAPSVAEDRALLLRKPMKLPPRASSAGGVHVFGDVAARGSSSGSSNNAPLLARSPVRAAQKSWGDDVTSPPQSATLLRNPRQSPKPTFESTLSSPTTPATFLGSTRERGPPTPSFGSLASSPQTSVNRGDFDPMVKHMALLCSPSSSVRGLGGDRRQQGRLDPPKRRENSQGPSSVDLVGPLLKSL